jgi:hypothetical protein
VAKRINACPSAPVRTRRRCARRNW